MECLETLRISADFSLHHLFASFTTRGISFYSWAGIQGLGVAHVLLLTLPHFWSFILSLTLATPFLGH